MRDLSDFQKEQISETIKRQQERSRATFLSDLRTVGKTAEGRRILYSIISESGVARDSFSGSDTNTTNYNLGRQVVGRILWNALNEADKNIFNQAQEEYESVEKNKLAEIEKIENPK
jgi:hypothetical protein